MEPTFSHVMSLLRRFSLPIALILISTAAVLLYLPDMEMPDSVRPFGSKFIVLALLAYALIILLFNYLQGSSAWHRSDEAPIQELMWEVRRLRDLAVHTTVPTPIPDELQKLISELKEQRVSSLQLETTEKKDLVEGLRAAVSKTLSEEFLRSIDDHYSAAAFRQSSHAKLLEDFDTLRRRLLQEISTLQRRANSNLSIGSVITLLAMGSLAYVVLSASHEFKSGTDLMSYYIPRVTFVIFIEVFSFFFLRLYKANLQDVKFYQNELTNVESKLIALKAALIENRDEGLAHILEELGRTERNFVLKKERQQWNWHGAGWRQRHKGDLSTA